MKTFTYEYLRKSTVIGRYLTFLFLLVLALTNHAQTRWLISENYSIEFEGTGAEGTFRGLEGDILFDPENLAQSRFNVSLDPATIATGNQTKNKHARGDSWFDVEKYTKIGFVSQRITKPTTGYISEGMLTMHGVSREARIEFTFSERNDTTGLFEGRMKVNREDFGIEGPLISFMVGEEFIVKLKVPVMVN